MKTIERTFCCLLLLLPIFTLMSCNNDDDGTPTNPIDQLPPATQTGENTFGYLVNGQPIVVTDIQKITAIYQQGILQLGGGIENSNTDIDIRIILQDPLTENTAYYLTNFPTHRSRYIDFYQYNECVYEYQDTFEGSIIFTKIDNINFIVSGTFEFSTATENCEIIRITNGRFDVQYIP